MFSDMVAEFEREWREDYVKKTQEAIAAHVANAFPSPRRNSRLELLSRATSRVETPPSIRFASPLSFVANANKKNILFLVITFILSQSMVGGSR